MRDAHDDPRFLAMCREHAIEGTAQVALCGEFWNRARALPAQSPAEAASTEGGGAVAWRCFHCDECFTTADSAVEHFGRTERQSPACQIDIAEYRAMEQRMLAYNQEDADIHREMHGRLSDHRLALVREEERGYSRGLADAKKHPEELGLVAALETAPTESIWPKYIAGIIETYIQQNRSNEDRETGIAKIIERRLKYLAAPTVEQGNAEVAAQTISDLMRVIDAYAFDYKEQGKLGPTRREVARALDEAFATPSAAAPRQEALTGYCDRNGGCVCGGDLPRIREGCSNWVKGGAA